MNQWKPCIALSLSLLLVGCSGGGGDEPSSADGGLADAAVAPSDAAAPDAAPEVDCSSLMALPLEATILTGFSGSEDFAFDGEGNLVSNDSGNVTKQPKTGAGMLLSPNVENTAGTRYLSNGDLILANVSFGELWRIEPSGAKSTIASGLLYPNGVEVGLDDIVYVAEHDGGRIRRVDPSSGENSVIATGLTNPNGLSFSPDYRTLYVNSFGDGTIHKLSVDDQGNWTEPELLGDIFDKTTENPCIDHVAGDLCLINNRAGICEVDATAVGLRCTTEGNGPEVFEAACQDVGNNQPCTVDVGNSSFNGTCQDNFGPLTCESSVGPEEVCTGRNNGDPCEVAQSDFGAYPGICSDEFGFGLYCVPEGSEGGEFRGGLDGMTVDACGNVYVTEYTVGFIWRFTPEGEREKVATLPSFWIPNIHWGSGIGGWDEDILYVMDRDEGRLFELDLGVKEKRRVFP